MFYRRYKIKDKIKNKTNKWKENGFMKNKTKYLVAILLMLKIKIEMIFSINLYNSSIIL